MASANVLAQLLGFASLPLLSRLFTPESFAILTLFTVTYSICLAVVTARVDWLVPNARTSAHAEGLVGLGTGVVAVNTAIVFLCVIVGSGWFESLLKVQSGSFVPLLLPCGVLAGGLYLLAQARAVHANDLSRVGASKVAQSAVTLALSVIFGVFSMHESGLVLGYVAGLVFAALTMHKELSRGARAAFGLASHRHLRLLRAYGNQILPSVSLSLINVLFQSAPFVLLAFFYDPIVVGWYGMVFRLATAPIGLITTALSHSFWAEASSLVKQDVAELRRFYSRSVVRLCIIAGPFAVAFLLAPLYLPALLGPKQWSGAGHLLAAACPYLIGMLIFSPTTHFVVYRKTHWQLIIDLATLCVAASVFAAIAISGHPAWMALLGASTTNLCGYLARFAALIRANELTALALRSQAYTHGAPQ